MPSADPEHTNQSSQTLPLALLGCGHIAQAVHLPALQQLQGVEVVAFAEADPERRANVAARLPSATAYPSADDLLADSTARAVVICLPTPLHAPTAIAAFEAGRHVYLEKPIALDVDSGKRVVEARQLAGTVGRVGFNFRFSDQVLQAQSALASGQIGQVVSVRTAFSIHPTPRTGWRGDRGQGGDVLLDLASHHVDLVRHLLGDEIVRVFAATRSLHAADDHATLTMETATGVHVQTFVSHGSADEFRLDVYGTNGRLTLDRTGAPSMEVTEATFDGTRARRIQRAVGRLHPRFLLRSPGHLPSFQRALDAFVGAIRGASTPGATLDDGLASLTVIEAARESARTRQPVDLASVAS